MLPILIAGSNLARYVEKIDSALSMFNHQFLLKPMSSEMDWADLMPKHRNSICGSDLPYDVRHYSESF